MLSNNSQSRNEVAGARADFFHLLSSSTICCVCVHAPGQSEVVNNSYFALLEKQGKIYELISPTDFAVKTITILEKHSY